MDSDEPEKREAAQLAATMVESGMTVGLGTGSTVAYLIPALAEMELSARFVATSPATAAAASAAGLNVLAFDQIDRLDIAIDGADQVAPDGWLIKGGGGAHTREKIVANAADRFVVIVSSEKLVERLAPPVPLEVSRYGRESTLRNLGNAKIRHTTPSPDGGIIADYLSDFEDPDALASFLSAMPGVVEHGLFPSGMVNDVVVAKGGTVEVLSLRH